MRRPAMETDGVSATLRAWAMVMFGMIGVSVERAAPVAPNAWEITKRNLDRKNHELTAG